VFSNVKSRPGLIERADNGTLFLDEAQHLPARIQKALLRITEDRKLTRLGESEPKTVNVRFILASNAPDDTHGLVHDLFSRVRKVEIPPLRDRIADIPKIFDAVLLKALERMALKPRLVKSYLKTEHYEALMLHGFSRTNIRGLIDLAERTAARIANGMETEAAVQRTFVETLAIQNPAQGPERVADEASARHNTDHASHYDDHREEITRTYMENKGNILKTVETLKQRGIGTSRQWLAVYAKLWALPHKRDLA
jgi:DNA-binding NtrC family response regulator